jgi:high affinity Mn2+ porin
VWTGVLKNRNWVRRSLAPCLLALAALGSDASARALASTDDSADASAAIASTPSRGRSEDRFSVHGQATYVEQAAFGFHAPYSGANSLSPGKDRGTTDVTLYLGARLWGGAEVWANPEVDQGFGLNNTVGLAGFPSGEAYKVGKSQPYFRLPRVFVRQTLSLAGANDLVEGAANQFQADRSANRLVFTVGKFGVADIFDVNSYAHDPRGDFLNWAALDAGTFDYAADAWGYTVGASVEWYEDVWAVRLGFF